jgi:hypothetical protein
MSGFKRVRQAIREVGVGVGTVALAVILTFWGSLPALQTAYLLMTVFVLLWTATTHVDRLRGISGRPRPLLFGGMAAMLAINASAFSLTGFTALLLSSGMLGGALVVGVARVLRQVGI